MDNQKFYNSLREVLQVMDDVRNVCEGMDVVCAELSERPRTTLVVGAFGALAYILSYVSEETHKLEEMFRDARNTKWPCEMNEEELKEYRSGRMRWL